MMVNKLYDLSYLKEIVNGDEELESQLMDIFIGQIPEFIGNMKKYAALRDFKMLGKEAHTAKSSILIFGMTETSEVLQKLQAAADNLVSDNVSEYIEMVETDFIYVLSDLKKLRAEL